MSWTDERVELLKKLWAEGLSASQIASELGGITRNAVIGKVHRLGLSGRGKTTAQQPKARKPRTTNTTAPARPRPTRSVGNTALKADYEPAPSPVVVARPSPVHELEIPPEERATILSLNEHRCKWPIGDPTREDFYFCGRHKEAGKPYCDHHASVAYQPVGDRRRDKRPKE